jgi:hypothetical protein
LSDLSFTQVPLTAQQVDHSQAYGQPESLKLITDSLSEMGRSAIKAPALETLKTSLTLWPLDLSTSQPLHLAAAVVSAFCYATGSRNYLAPILIRPRTCSAALSAEEPDTSEVYHNS